METDVDWDDMMKRRDAAHLAKALVGDRETRGARGIVKKIKAAPPSYELIIDGFSIARKMIDERKIYVDYTVVREADLLTEFSIILSIAGNSGATVVVPHPLSFPKKEKTMIQITLIDGKKFVAPDNVGVVNAMKNLAFLQEDRDADYFIDWFVGEASTLKGKTLVVPAGSLPERAATLISQMIAEGLATSP